MKEITAYQSDDGKFVGTYEEVLEYEKKDDLEELIVKINEQFLVGEWDNIGLYKSCSLILFLQNPDVKELFYLLNG